MADIADIAALREQEFLEDALAELLLHSPKMLLPVGVCYNCHDHIPPGLRFCDKDCREDYDARLRAEKRRG